MCQELTVAVPLHIANEVLRCPFPLRRRPLQLLLRLRRPQPRTEVEPNVEGEDRALLDDDDDDLPAAPVLESGSLTILEVA